MKNKSSPSTLLLLQGKQRPRPPGFECGELFQEEGSIGSVAFYCTLPLHPRENSSKNTTTATDNNTLPYTRLAFSCRDRSVGVLESEESVLTNEELQVVQDVVDPNFFDAGYTLAGRTGFQVWAGTRLMLESLLWPLPQEDCQTLLHLQTKIRQGSNVVELGSGVGVVGTSLAAMGANVLLTDLPTLVGHSVLPNLSRNQQNSRLEEEASKSTSPPPDWLYKIASTFDPDLLEEVDEVCDHPTLCFPIGDSGGWASVAAVDWTVPLYQQVPDMPSSIDYVVASDCVWLVSMLNSLLDTAAAIFALANNHDGENDERHPPHLLLSFQRRDKDNQDDAKFTRVDTVLENVKQRGWHVECLAWRYVSVEGESEPKELFLFDISTVASK